MITKVPLLHCLPVDWPVDVVVTVFATASHLLGGIPGTAGFYSGDSEIVRTDC